MTERYYTPSDRDYLIRTVIGESDGQPDEGQAAVAHVALNRLNSGRWGNSLRSVVLSPWQFEPWQTRRDELLGYAPEHPAYVRASKIVDNVLAGKSQDPTGGATHFLQEEEVRRRRGGSLPDWASGGSKRIGAHSFYKPGDDNFGEKRVASAIDKYTKSDAGGGQTRQIVPTSAEPAPLAEGRTLMERYTKPYTPPAPETETQIPVPQPTVPGTPEAVVPTVPTGFLERSKDRLSRGLASGSFEGITSLPGRIWNSTAEIGGNAIDLFKSGVSDLKEGNLIPSGPISDPSQWKAGGLLKTLGGGLGTVFSPVAAVEEQIVSGPVAHATGSRTIGEKAGLLSNIMIPSRAVERGVNRLRPTAQARGRLGESNVTQEQLERLRADPTLTPADVNPAIRQKAMGAALETEDAKNLAYSRANERAKAAPERVREAYTGMAGEAPDVGEVLAGYKKRTSERAEKGFGDALRGAAPVDLGPLTNKIERTLYPHVGGKRISESTLAHGPFEYELAKLRGKLYDETGTVTDVDRLHKIQSELGTRIYNLSKGQGADRNVAGELKPFHDALVKAIDDAAGGKYQPARKQFKQDMEIQEAFDKGIEILQNRKNKAGLLEDTPDAWRRWVKDATIEEIEAARLGARSIIEQYMMGNRHSARRGTDLADTPYDFEKFKILFGDKEATRLKTLLDNEREKAITNTLFTGNSKTAEAQAGRDQMRVRKPTDPIKVENFVGPLMAEAGSFYFNTGLMPGMAGAAAIGTKHMSNRLMGALDNARNRRFVDMALTSGDEALDHLRSSIRHADYQNRLLSRPTPPITYTPPEVREYKHVPLKKD